MIKLNKKESSIQESNMFFKIVERSDGGEGVDACRETSEQ